jgi:hypothetical protein
MVIPMKPALLLRSSVLLTPLLFGTSLFSSGCYRLSKDDYDEALDVDQDGVNDSEFGGADCDGTDPNVNPNATELCDGIDNNCDGNIDEATAEDALTWYADTDGDTYGDPDNSTPACEVPEGYLEDSTDCDDTNAAISPEGTEVCNGDDDDCDGTVDEDDATDVVPWYADNDGDDFGDAADVVEACDAPDGYVEDDTDCDDTDGDVWPGQVEVCNEIDDDCDEETDEGDAEPGTWYADADGDDYGNPDDFEVTCSPSANYITDDKDCDDTDENVSPDGEDICNGIDDNCDGDVDEGDAAPTVWYADADEDSFGDPDESEIACEPSTGYVEDNTDCDDTDGDISPDGVEVCNDADDDCDGRIDGPTSTDAVTYTVDADDDGYGEIGGATVDACEEPSGYSQDDTDCNDAEPTVYPGHPEICDLLDNDCDTATEYADHYVPTDFLTVQLAIAGAASGDSICVGAGTYSGPFSLSKDLTLEGQDKETTFLDGGGTGGVLNLSSGTTSMVVRGFTLQDGFSSVGAAITANSNQAQLEDLIIRDNASFSSGQCTGPTIYTNGTVHPTFRRVDIIDNTANCNAIWGNLAYAYGGGTLVMENVRFLGNEGVSTGATNAGLTGVYANIEIINGIFAGNTIIPPTTPPGPGVRGMIAAMVQSALTLENVSIYGNSINTSPTGAAESGLFYHESGFTASLTNVAMSSNTVTSPSPGYSVAWGAVNQGHSNVYDQAFPAYSDGNPTGSNGNIAVDPAYTDVSGTDPSAWDLTLATGSALIDAGDPSILDPDGSTSDIGAYGGPGGDSW